MSLISCTARCVSEVLRTVPGTRRNWPGLAPAVDFKGAPAQGAAGLRGAPILATDLRASVSLIIAGLVAQGPPRIPGRTISAAGNARWMAVLGCRSERVSAVNQQMSAEQDELLRAHARASEELKGTSSTVRVSTMRSRAARFYLPCQPISESGMPANGN
jgi:hypothetical protein